MIMKNGEIKFCFDTNFLNKNYLDNIFKKIKSLNIRFDENLNPYYSDNKIIYEFEDISKLDQQDIEIKINSFFSFTFKDITIVFLEKFIPYEPHKYNHESCKN